MTLNEALQIVNSALSWLPPTMTSDRTRVQLLTTGKQESKFIHRYQVLNDPTKKGPARSFFQMERGGAITNVLDRPATRELAQRACRKQGVQPTPNEVWHAVENDDFLAVVFARLEYWTSPLSMPQLGDSQGAWNMYVKTWRPGKPHPETWDAYYDEALRLVTNGD